MTRAIFYSLSGWLRVRHGSAGRKPVATVRRPDRLRTSRRVPAVAALPSVSVTSPVAPRTSTVLVFSHRPEVRDAIISAVGRRPAPDVGRVRFLEAAGIAEVLAAADAGEVDLAILDGEAQPTGGMGLSRQLKNEIDECPPVIVTVRRNDDRWLATWSQADAVLVHPLDPLTAAETVADVLRRAQAESDESRALEPGPDARALGRG
jgi:DNA-binding NtrC family response regulator